MSRGCSIAAVTASRVTLDFRVLLQRPALPQRLEQVPRDRFALAVGVGGEYEPVVILQRLGNGPDVALGLRIDLPGHLESVGGIDRAILWRQIAHMAVGRENRIVLAEITADRLGFCRGLDDDNGH